jgi:hypothetical protein
MNVLWRWIVPPVVLTAIGIAVVVVFSYVAVGGPPRFMGGKPMAAPQMRGAPIGQGQAGQGDARFGREGPRGREGFRGREGMEGRNGMEGGGGFGTIFGKSLIFIGLPAVLTLGASWYLFRRSGSSPEMTTVGEVPVED